MQIVLQKSTKTAMQKVSHLHLVHANVCIIAFVASRLSGEDQTLPTEYKIARELINRTYFEHLLLPRVLCVNVSFHHAEHSTTFYAFCQML